MHFDRLVGLRTFCRRIGVLKLARWQSEARVARRRREYTRTQRATVTIAVDGLSPRILVSDAFEYARALSWEDDAHLLRAITGRLAPGSICWDIGASVGIYTLVMAGKAGAAGAVVSFEPEPRSNARLRENVHFNKFTNVTVFDCALGSKRGQFTLNVAEHASAGTHSLATPAVAHQRRAATLIEVFPGDQILAEKLLP